MINKNRLNSIYDIKVSLLNPEDIKGFIKNHGEFACTCYNTPVSCAKGVGKKVLESGHLSGSRADYFKFKVELVSRSCADQVFRSDIGVAKNMQSLRYVDKSNFGMTLPDEILNTPEILDAWCDAIEHITDVYNFTVDKLQEKYSYTGEKAQEIARGILPMDISTEFTIAFDLEALINFFNKRLCTCAQKPIRFLAKCMKELVLEVAPIYKPYFVPMCQKLLYCPESEERCCGLSLTKDKVISKINK